MMLARQRAISGRLIRRFGGGLTYTLRRKNSVLNPTTVAAGASTGAASITVNSANGNGPRLAVQGSKFTVAGVAGTYTVAADASGNSNPLAVTFTPVLAGPAALGAVVTWTQPYATHTYQAMNGSSQHEKEEQMVAAGELTKWLLYDADLPAPRNGDELGGLSIQRVEPIGSAGVARYKVTVGAAS